ncbi:MAG TPA: AAA family ATPase [Myxococcota bacterium]|nr:AAA family ATPase [Myxococcota bacterium]
MTARVITFYSFKGGVGRTLALVNVACLLTERGQRVAIVDLDLEAPGVDAFLRGADGRAWDQIRPSGFLGFVRKWELGAEDPHIASFAVPATHPTIPGRVVQLVPPGQFVPDYPQRLRELAWDRIHDAERFLHVLYEQLRSWPDVDVVLLDSRTGMTDVGSLCTLYLPDEVVITFAPNLQGVEGAATVGQAIQNRRAAREPRAPSRVRFLASRVDRNEGDLYQLWMRDARQRLVGLGDLEEPELPYDSRAAYGELVVAGPEHQGRPIRDALDAIVGRLLGDEAPPPEDDDTPRPTLTLARERLGVWRAAEERLQRALPGIPSDLRRCVLEIEEAAQAFLAVSTPALRELAALADLLSVEPAATEIQTVAGAERTLSEWEATEQRARASATERADAELDELGIIRGPQTERLRDELIAAWCTSHAPARDVRLRNVRQDLHQATLRARVERGDFQRADVTAAYGSSGVDAWLDEQLQAAVEARAADRAWHILRARAEVPFEPTVLHWAALDLCERPTAKERLTIAGEAMWLGAWSDAASPPGPNDTESARLLLMEVAEEAPEVIERLAERAGRTIAALWETNRDAAIGLLRERTLDPVVTRALTLLTEAGGPHAIALGAAGLRHVDASDRRLHRAVIDGLVQAGRAAELTAWCRLRPEVIAPDHILRLLKRGGLPSIAAIATALSEQASLPEALLTDPQVLRVLALAAPHALAQHHAVIDALGVPHGAWPSQADGRAVWHAAAAKGVLREINLHTTWHDNESWKHALRDLWRRRLQAISEGDSTTLPDVEQDIAAIRRDARRRNPEGPALRALQSQHKEFTDHLARLQESLRGGTLTEATARLKAFFGDTTDPIARSLAEAAAPPTIAAADAWLAATSSLPDLWAALTGERTREGDLEAALQVRDIDRAERVDPRPDTQTAPIWRRFAEDYSANTAALLAEALGKLERLQALASTEDVTTELHDAIEALTSARAELVQQAAHDIALFRRLHEAEREMDLARQRADEELARLDELARRRAQALIDEVQTKIAELKDSDDAEFERGQRAERELRRIRGDLRALESLAERLRSPEEPPAVDPSPTIIIEPTPTIARSGLPPLTPAALPEGLRVWLTERTRDVDDPTPAPVWDPTMRPVEGALGTWLYQRGLRFLDDDRPMYAARCFLAAWWWAATHRSASATERPRAAAWGFLLALALPFEDDTRRVDARSRDNHRKLLFRTIDDLPMARLHARRALPELGLQLAAFGDVGRQFLQDHLLRWLRAHPAAASQVARGLVRSTHNPRSAWHMLGDLAEVQLPEPPSDLTSLGAWAREQLVALRDTHLAFLGALEALEDDPTQRATIHDPGLVKVDVTAAGGTRFVLQVTRALGVPLQAIEVTAWLAVGGESPTRSRQVVMLAEPDVPREMAFVGPEVGQETDATLRVELTGPASPNLIPTHLQRFTLKAGPARPWSTSNPFLVGQPLPAATQLFGRDGEIGNILESLVGSSRDNLVVVRGDRRIGKTSLLRALQEHTRVKQRYQARVYIDHEFTAAESPASYYRRLLSRLREEDATHDLPLEPDDLRLTTSPHEEFHRVMGRVDRVLRQSNRRMLVIIDELEKLFELVEGPDPRLPGETIATLRAVIQATERLGWVLAGVTDVLAAKMASPDQRLYKAGLTVDLATLQDADARRLLHQPVRAVFRWTVPALDLAVREAGGQPYLLQSIGHAMFRRAERSGWTTVCRGDLEALLDSELSSDATSYAFVVPHLSDAELRLARALGALQSVRSPVPLPWIASELHEDLEVVTTAMRGLSERFKTVFEVTRHGARIRIGLLGRYLASERYQQHSLKL